MANWRTYRRLTDAIANGDVWDGDVLLYRPADRFGRWLARWCGGVHCHAAMTVWWREVPMVLETREWYGARAVTLSSEANRKPGLIDVFRVRGDLHAGGLRNATAAMIRHAGARYGYWSVLRASIYRIPFWRLHVEPDTNDSAVSDYPPYCSELIDQALRKDLIDVAPNKAGRLTTPPDLAESAVLQYQYTIGEAPDEA